MPECLRAVLALCLLLPAIVYGQAQNQPGTGALSEADAKAAASLHERAARGTGAFEITASLTTEIGPRPAGSEGDRAAVAWALNKLNSLGFQNVRTQDVLVPHWVRGPLQIEITDPWPQILMAEALGGSVGTGANGIEAEVIHAADVDALKSLNRDQVQGRIVFLNKRTERTRDVRGYLGAVKTRTEGASVAASMGAVAVVIRSIGTDNNRLAHTGTVRYAPDTPRIPAIALSNPDADMLERQILSGRTVKLRLKLSTQELPPQRSANVIGEILGSNASGEPSDEIVLLGAHLDSWDVGTGALDDAAGVAIVIEAARLINELKLPHRRTLRVVLFANEEFGLTGANAYAAQPATEITKHIVAMEADLGAGPIWRFDARVADPAVAKLQFFANALQPLGIEFGGNAADGGADIGPLRRAGVPIFSLAHDATRYFDYHHTMNDTLDKVDPKALDQSVAAYAIAAYLAASMDGDFGRLPVTPTK